MPRVIPLPTSLEARGTLVELSGYDYATIDVPPEVEGADAELELDRLRSRFLQPQHLQVGDGATGRVRW